MEDKVIKLEQEVLELKTRLVEIAKICDNLIEKVKNLESGAGTHGVYLDGVEEYYRDSIIKSLNSEKR